MTHTQKIEELLIADMGLFLRVNGCISSFIIFKTSTTASFVNRNLFLNSKSSNDSKTGILSRKYLCCLGTLGSFSSLFSSEDKLTSEIELISETELTDVTDVI